jgi:hypothetical protein
MLTSNDKVCRPGIEETSGMKAKYEWEEIVNSKSLKL